MRKKRVIAFLLSLVLLCLTACGGESTDTEEWLMDELEIDGAPQTNTGIQACADDVILMGNTESEDPLRICIDLMDYGTSDSTQDTKALNDFLYQLKETVGLENVVLEIIPSPNIFNGSQEEFEARAEVRTAAIERIETEMMNGGGPDVFLMTYMPYLGLMWLDGSEKYEKTGCLFQYPEKAMEYGY
ncbi:MAG: hypothetical protein IJO13_03890, partial [Lachnospiraceae bacterium]|nr:hypothetical protein [Lachnospiraceae bacterium]